jgi:hypothetical protein
MRENDKMNPKVAKFAFAAFLVLLMLVPPSVGLGIGGAIFIEDVSPGQKLVHEITVSNDENISIQNMTAEVYGFERSLDGVNVEIPLENDTGSFTARPFLSVEPKILDLGPGERKTLLLTGTVPEDVGPGGKYALVIIKTAPKVNSGISISTAIQVVVLLTIKDSKLIRTGNISGLTASKADNESVAVAITFENTGNIHYKPFVEATLKSENSDILANEEPKEIDGTILPMNLRLCKVNLVSKTSLPPGTYTVEAKVTNEDGTVLDSKETAFTV